jgi:hypothetical protein
MKKIQNMLVWLRKMVLAPHKCAVAGKRLAPDKCAVAGKRRSNAVHLQKTL